MELGRAEWIGARAEDYLRNPFEQPDAHAEGERAMGEVADRGGVVLDRLMSAERTSLARRFVLASACFHTVGGKGAPLLDARRTPDRVFATLKLPRDAVAGMAAAAARCHHALAQLLGVSAAINQVRAALWRTAFGESLYEALRLQPFLREQHVLLLGETGTGKELAAQVIAGAVPGPDAPSQALNAAAIPRDLLESELFGHVKGAFTGAHGDRTGKIAAASGGTLFLDEVADLAPEVQPKLLRVVATGQVIPLGANEPRVVDVRYVCATSQPLVEQVEQGAFRRDLYERLAGLTIVIPPLRDRPEDLGPIAEGLFARFSRRMGLTEDGQGGGTSTAQMPRMIAAQARLLGWLGSDEARAHAWPGNVRELENELRTRLLGFTRRSPAPAPAAPVRAAAAPADLERFAAGEASLREVEDWYVLHVLAQQGYRQRAAARILGIDRGTLARRLKHIEDGTD